MPSIGSRDAARDPSAPRTDRGLHGARRSLATGKPQAFAVVRPGLLNASASLLTAYGMDAPVIGLIGQIPQATSTGPRTSARNPRPARAACVTSPSGPNASARRRKRRPWSRRRSARDHRPAAARRARMRAGYLGEEAGRGGAARRPTPLPRPRSTTKRSRRRRRCSARRQRRSSCWAAARRTPRRGRSRSPRCWSAVSSSPARPRHDPGSQRLAVDMPIGHGCGGRRRRAGDRDALLHPRTGMGHRMTGSRSCGSISIRTNRSASARQTSRFVGDAADWLSRADRGLPGTTASARRAPGAGRPSPLARRAAVETRAADRVPARRSAPHCRRTASSSTRSRRWLRSRASRCHRGPRTFLSPGYQDNLGLGIRHGPRRAGRAAGRQGPGDRRRRRLPLPDRASSRRPCSTQHRHRRRRLRQWRLGNVKRIQQERYGNRLIASDLRRRFREAGRFLRHRLLPRARWTAVRGRASQGLRAERASPDLGPARRCAKSLGPHNDAKSSRLINGLAIGSPRRFHGVLPRCPNAGCRDGKPQSTTGPRTGP